MLGVEEDRVEGSRGREGDAREPRAEEIGSPSGAARRQAPGASHPAFPLARPRVAKWGGMHLKPTRYRSYKYTCRLVRMMFSSDQLFSPPKISEAKTLVVSFGAVLMWVPGVSFAFL